MALSPLQSEELRVIEVATEIEPSQTYKLGENTIGGLIDGDEAIHQFVAKAVRTTRDRFLIYDDQYGCEIDGLIGADLSQELLQTEVPRLIREALIYDGRITDVTNVEINRLNERLYITFSVVTINDVIINEEVTI
jgi:hypothetical protein